MEYDPRSLVVPERLGWLREHDAGRQWLGALPDLLADVTADWSLRVAAPYDGSRFALVLPATLADGSKAVLKLQYPDRESAHEAAALRCWDGDGVVRLIAHDERRAALLIEHCSPGDYLAEADPDNAVSVFIGLLPLLWKPPAPPFASLADEARQWASDLMPEWERAGRPCERRLIDAARDTLESLTADSTEQVLLHQDLHSYNVLRATRQPWLVIDPKPLVGERAFAVAPIVRDYELGHSRRQLRQRLDRLSTELDVDRERARGWTFAQTVVWALRGGVGSRYHVESARWLLAMR
ncbi:aminoglycoside phosphotransferase family protein [Rugosimonospora africana]|uniref:Hydroxyurea phosphotransferase n=1 Tax=Rugosimonospora africana TaxID=556532 RepID=A0A8J3VT39_9ACTN|nr:aminoglycoside phosphotransferase family protein [Rugosimonospora africana]GIH18012.1 hydroxyurea phosphotransferase [Rugosimonospora africana]